MSLTVWVLVSDPMLSMQLRRVMKSPQLRELAPCWLVSPEEVEPLLSRIFDPAGLLPKTAPAASSLPDLLILQQGPPWDKGTDLLDRLRRFHPVDYLPLIDAPLSSDLIRCREKGAFDLIALPATHRRLRDSLERWLRARQLLKGRLAMGQNAIDRFYQLQAPDAPVPVSQLPGPSGRAFLRKLYSLCQRYPEGISVAEAVRLMGVSPSSVRTYVKLLVEMGLLEEMTRLTGKRGRPVLLYRPVD